jgi:hypothetical protein
VLFGVGVSAALMTIEAQKKLGLRIFEPWV